MELEEIYLIYPWLQKPTNGNIYTPMVEAAIGKRPDIDSMNYFEAVVTLHMYNFGKDALIAVDEVKQNVGYWAGYFDAEAMQKVKEVYGVVHPVFG